MLAPSLGSSQPPRAGETLESFVASAPSDVLVAMLKSPWLDLQEHAAFIVSVLVTNGAAQLAHFTVAQHLRVVRCVGARMPSKAYMSFLCHTLQLSRYW